MRSVLGVSQAGGVEASGLSSSAIHASEDAARRRFAAGRTGLDRRIGHRSPPDAFEIDQRHLGNICDRSELASDKCAGRQPIGDVKDETPLLEKPLQGLAYAVSGFGKLPHVVFILNGQVTITPEGISSSVKGGRLQTVIPVIPDVPVGHFRLTLLGGSKGYLSNTQSLCSGSIASNIEFTAQNGKHLTQEVKTKTACKVKKNSKRHGKRGGVRRRRAAR